MQTNFTPEQLKDPRTAEADRILRRCVHCGLCTAVCSTYVVVGDERDSPRGRIYLMKDMFERGRDASPEVQHHIDRCLSCLSCMTTCPGGVDYMHLVDLARVHINETGTRSLKDRFMRRLLAAVVPYPEKFRMALKAAPLGRPFIPLMRALGLKEMAAMMELAPARLPALPKYEGPGEARTSAERRARVVMLAGCAQPVLRPEINDATIRLLARRGVDVVVGKGPGATSIPLEVAPFTLVGATTRSGALTGPLRDRFGFTAHMDFYEPAELERVLTRSAGILGIELGAEAGAEIARRSRGTPRIANRLLRRVRDYAEVRADGVITRDIAKSALAVYDVDELGLDRLDRAVLSALTKSFGGGPVGVSTLAVAVGEEATTVEEVCEPFLVRAGMIARTPRGRVATPLAWTHLGMVPPPRASGLGQPGLFE